MNITNKDEFISQISDLDEIGVRVKGDLTVIQYNVAFPETFDTQAAKECRGIVFDNTSGKCLRRPYPKFFNVNEKEETQMDKIKTERILWVADKLDGTLISPVIRNGNIFWGTKRLADDFNDAVWRWLYSQEIEVVQQYVDLVWHYVSTGITPIFEFHDPKCAGTVIVIHYDKAFLKLTGLRDILTGEMFDVTKINHSAKYPKVEIVDHLAITSLEEIKKELEDAEGVEGRVIMLEKTGLVKMKSPWYVKRHRVKSLFEYDYIKAQLFLGTHEEISMDDIAPEMDKEDRESLAKFGNKLKDMLAKVRTHVITRVNGFETKKEYGLFLKASESNTIFDSIIFSLIGASDAEEKLKQQVIEHVGKYTSSNSRFDMWKASVEKI